MATLVPPPTKRQKLEIAEKARLQQEIQTIPDNLGSIRVQFFDQATGEATGPAVSVPVADATVKNLETLLNTLQGNVGTHSVCLAFSCLIRLHCENCYCDKSNPARHYRMRTNESRTDSHIRERAKMTRPSTSSRTSIIPY